MKAEIYVPSSLDDITLGQYMKYVKLETEDNKGTPFLMQKAVEIFCNIDLKDIANIRYRSLVEIIEHLDALFGSKYDFQQRFTMDGVEYGFVPVLDDLTMGEYVDLDNYYSEWDNMHKAMAVLYRPVTHSKGERYDIEEYKGTAEAHKYLDMPVSVVLGTFLFFFNLSKELLTITLSCLGEREAEWIPLLHSEGSGVGIRAYMHSLKGMLQELNISPN